MLAIVKCRIENPVSLMIIRNIPCEIIKPRGGGGG
jgi:hypothetical protein